MFLLPPPKNCGEFFEALNTRHLCLSEGKVSRFLREALT
jgi:hypothetical protein